MIWSKSPQLSRLARVPIPFSYKADQGLKSSPGFVAEIVALAFKTSVILGLSGSSFRSPITMILALGSFCKTESRCFLQTAAAAERAGELLSSPPRRLGQWFTYT